MNYKVIFSNRKTLSLQIDDNLEILVKAPKNFPKYKIDEFVLSHSKWLKKAYKRKEQSQKVFNIPQDEALLLRKKAEIYIPLRVEYYSKIMGLSYGTVKITSAKKRYGSCSGKNNLCFSLYLMQFPLEAVDYVVVHELSHIVYKNHSKEFYKHIEKYMPDYKQRQNILKF